MINQINLGQAPATLIHENPNSCYLDSAFKKTDANGQGLPKTLCLVAKNQYRIYVTRHLWWDPIPITYQVHKQNNAITDHIQCDAGWIFVTVHFHFITISWCFCDVILVHEQHQSIARTWRNRVMLRLQLLDVFGSKSVSWELVQGFGASSWIEA